MVKKLFILACLSLTACDKPIAQFTLDCNVAYQGHATIVDTKIYQDKVELKINDTKVTLNKIEDKSYLTRAFQRFEGTMPGTKTLVRFGVDIDINQDGIYLYSLAFSDSDYGLKIPNGCNVMTPIKHSYPKPSKEEICIENINDKVSCKGGCNDETFEGLTIAVNYRYHTPDNSGIRYETHQFDIPAEDAIKLSKNWNYYAPKFYINEDKPILEEHEKDACVVWENLKQYMIENDLYDVKHIYLSQDDQTVD